MLPAAPDARQHPDIQVITAALPAHSESVCRRDPSWAIVTESAVLVCALLQRARDSRGQQLAPGLLAADIRWEHPLALINEGHTFDDRVNQQSNSQWLMHLSAQLPPVSDSALEGSLTVGVSRGAPPEGFRLSGWG